MSLEGLSLATRRDFSDRTGLTGSVPAGGTTVIDVDIESRGQMPFMLLNGDTVMQAISPGRPDGAGTAQAFPDGSNEWFIVGNSTRGRGNNPERYENVVINEVMFNPPGDHRGGEFIELYNRGDSDVDLTGWRFAERVNYAFQSGSKIKSGGYLVVAADIKFIKRVYRIADVVGNYIGELSNPGEMLRLEEAYVNLSYDVD